MVFLELLTSSIIPIFIVIGAGALVDRIHHFDLKTLSRMNFYILSPSLLFLLVYDTRLEGGEIFSIVAFQLSLIALLVLLGWGLFSLKGLRPHRINLLTATLFMNAGNFGIPLMQLAFGDQAVEVQAIILMVQAFLMFTLGIILINSDQLSLQESIKTLLSYPLLYAILLAVIMRQYKIPLADPIRSGLEIFKAGYVVVALVMLGAQLSRSKLVRDVTALGVINVARLLLSPMIAWGLLQLFVFEPLIKQVLWVAAGLPAAVYSYVLAAEFDQHPDFASQVVFWTTLLSGLTLPLLLMLSQSLF